jgi:hypothetical protein
MRMMMRVSIPAAAGNRAFRDGVLPKTMMAFVEKFRPEASYFAPSNGRRTAYFVFDMKEPSLLPSAVEPFFSALEAEIEVTPAMNLEDMKTGVERAMKQQ